jgi:hypothetical protein
VILDPGTHKCMHSVLALKLGVTPTKYNRGRESTMRFDNTTKQIHNVDSDGCKPLEIEEKIFGSLRNQKMETKPSTLEKRIITRETVIVVRGEALGKAKTDHYAACTTKEMHKNGQEIVQYFLSPRKR